MLIYVYDVESYVIHFALRILPVKWPSLVPHLSLTCPSLSPLPPLASQRILPRLPAHESVQYEGQHSIGSALLLPCPMPLYPSPPLPFLYPPPPLVLCGVLQHL